MQERMRKQEEIDRLMRANTTVIETDSEDTSSDEDTTDYR